MRELLPRELEWALSYRDLVFDSCAKLDADISLSVTFDFGCFLSDTLACNNNMDSAYF
jgi:hypothetical protein